MTRFNLSEWAVNNRSIVVFLMLLCVIGGIGAYEQLGRQEQCAAAAGRLDADQAEMQRVQHSPLPSHTQHLPPHELW